MIVLSKDCIFIFDRFGFQDSRRNEASFEEQNSTLVGLKFFCKNSLFSSTYIINFCWTFWQNTNPIRSLLAQYKSN